MAITFTKAANASTSNATATTVSISATAAGSLLVIIAYQGLNNTSTLSITDNGAGGQQTWTQVPCGGGSGCSSGGYVSSGSDRGAMFYVQNAKSVSSVTATWSGNLSATVPVVLMVFAGVALNTPFDSNNANAATNTQTGTHSAFASSAISTNNTNDVLVYGVLAGGTMGAPTAGSGFILDNNAKTGNGRAACTYDVVAAAQSGTSTTLTYTSANLTQVSLLAAFADTDQGITVVFEDDTPPQFQPPPTEPIISIW